MDTLKSAFIGMDGTELIYEDEINARFKIIDHQATVIFLHFVEKSISQDKLDTIERIRRKLNNNGCKRVFFVSIKTGNVHVNREHIQKAKEKIVALLPTKTLRQVRPQGHSRTIGKVDKKLHIRHIAS